MTEPLSADTLSDLFSLLAHDLRNPLSALQSNLSFLASSPERFDPDEREAMQDAVASSDALAHMIDSLELLSKVLGSEPVRPPRVLLVAAVVKDVLVRHRNEAMSHGVELQPNCPMVGQGLRVHSDPEMFTHALGALVRNAIQYSRAGGTVSVLSWRDGERCGVLVADAGPRLAPDFLESAFDAQTQCVAKKRLDARYSRGLGLYCARTAARLGGAEVHPVEPPAAANNAFLLSALSVEA